MINDDQFCVNTQVLPHQTQWSQRTEHSPARDANNERRIINNCQKAQWIVFTKTLALSLQTIFKFI